MSNDHDYKNLWYEKLKEQIIEDVNSIKSIDETNIEIDIEKFKEWDRIIIIKILNNNLLTNIKDYLSVDEILIHRTKNVFLCVDMAIKYAKRNNLPKISGKFFFAISDRALTKKYPFFYYAKSKIWPGFLYPDFNFTNIFTKKRQAFKKYKCKMSDKKDLIHFKGVSSSESNSRIREKMKDFTEPFNIVINHKSEPCYNITKYRYLLDLPGTEPWSVRLAEIYMSNSFPFRIIYLNKKGERISQFYEKMFLAKESYKGIKCMVNNKLPIPEKPLEYIKRKCTEHRIFLNDNPKIYNVVVTENFDKMMALTEDHVSFYMYTAMMEYTKIIKKFTNKDN